MNANEAYEKTYKIAKNKIDLAISDIEKEIEIVVNNGDFTLSYYKKLDKGVEDLLKLRGFKIEYKDDHPREAYNLISWKR